jgi:hypothetical protein
LTDDSVNRGAWTTRTFTAPTEPEADSLAEPVIKAFEQAGWRVQERTWIPGDRRPSLLESVVLSPQSENLLDADGSLHITFAAEEANAVAPTVAAPARVIDTFEDIGGTRYRRLVPRWILGGVVFLIGLLIVFSMLGGFPGFGDPQPDADGVCPLGYAPSYSISNGTTTAISCTRI